MKIILDTDIDTDCDDAGALAVLHTLGNRGVAEPLGVVCSTPVPACVSCVRAINAWCGRPELPVAAIAEARWKGRPPFEGYLQHRALIAGEGRLYNEQIGESVAGEEIPEAVSLYRKLLASQEDGSVTICAVGTLTALAALLDSPPDEISPLSGHDLVARKVTLLASMAVASYPRGHESFNWRMDLVPAAKVIGTWPTTVAVQGDGKDVQTGRRLIESTPAGNPVSEAYRIWFGDDYETRPSWDQLTLIYAAGIAPELFHEKSGLSLTLDSESGAHEWSPLTHGHERRHVKTVGDTAELARRVEDLMIEAVAGANG